MGFCEDLKSEIVTIFKSSWDTRDGQVIPESTDLKLANDAVKLDGCVLYADMHGSTDLVRTKSQTFAAEVYKAYLLAACRVIALNDGTITAFDGDRVMAVYIGDSKCTNAVKTALNLNYLRINVVNTSLQAQYKTDFTVQHCVGVDKCALFVARTGIRKYNDLVWVGNAANFAAKMSGINELPYNTFITKTVYDVMSKDVKYAKKDGCDVDMWEQRNWSAYDQIVYRSHFYWKPL